MLNRLYTATFALLGAFALSASAGHAASILLNGDFELGNANFTSDFTEAPLITAASTYAVTTDPNLVHHLAASYGDHTTGTGKMLAVNGTSTGGGEVFYRQTVSVLSGVDYVFSLFSSTWYGGATAKLGLVINGTTIDTTFSPTNTGIWEQTTFTAWSALTSGSATIELVNLSSSYAGNDFAVDDLSFIGVDAPVPLPATLPLILVGLGVFGLVRRRS